MMRATGGLFSEGATFKRDWTKGSIIRNLLSLSWPIVSSFGLYTMCSVVDVIWVGKLGSTYIAAVGVAVMAVWLALSANMGLAVGTRALVAHFVGAGDAKSANHVAKQALVAAAVYGVCTAAIAVAFA